jgi:hypothetical protein
MAHFVAADLLGGPASSISENDPTDGDESTHTVEQHYFNVACTMRQSLIAPLFDAAARGDSGTLLQFLDAETAIIEGAPADGEAQWGAEWTAEQHSVPLVRRTDAAGNTAAHWAAGAGHSETLRLLIDAGSDLNMQNLLGDGVLHRAVWRGHMDCVELLLRYADRIDFNQRNRHGARAVDLARNPKVKDLLLRCVPLGAVGNHAMLVDPTTDTDIDALSSPDCSDDEGDDTDALGGKVLLVTDAARIVVTDQANLPSVLQREAELEQPDVSSGQLGWKELEKEINGDAGDEDEDDDDDDDDDDDGDDDGPPPLEPIAAAGPPPPVPPRTRPEAKDETQDTTSSKAPKKKKKGSAGGKKGKGSRRRH